MLPAQRPERAAGAAVAADGMRAWAHRFWRAARDVFWGLALFETYHEVELEARRHRDAFEILILGEMLGIPLMNTTIGLRLLPYVVGDFERFRGRLLREPEILDHAPHIH